MSTHRTVATKLAAARSQKQVVKFKRPFETGTVHGYVVDIGLRWFALAPIDDRIRFDGFQCFRLEDVLQLEVPSPRADFFETVLKKRHEHMPKMPAVKFGSLEELLKTANEAFPLITIHREKLYPHECLIGRVIDIKNECLSLLYIGIDGHWDEDEVDQYLLRDITRVDFGGEYEEALFLVGGYPPKRK